MSLSLGAELRGFQPRRLPLLQGSWICLLEIACPCQDIVVNVPLTWELSERQRPICHLDCCWIHLKKHWPLFAGDCQTGGGLHGSKAEITGSWLCPVWPLLAWSGAVEMIVAEADIDLCSQDDSLFSRRASSTIQAIQAERLHIWINFTDCFCACMEQKSNFLCVHE